MRSVNWNNVTAKTDDGTGTGFRKPTPGGYVVRIVSAEDHEDWEKVEMVWDIAEGEFQGHYSDEFGINSPWAHRLYMRYSDRSLGWLKQNLECFRLSNPGFDPFAAWDAGRLDMFVGRIVGVNLQEQEQDKKDRDGNPVFYLEVAKIVPAQDVRDGKVKPLEKKLLKKNGQAGNGAGVVTAGPSYTPPTNAYQTPTQSRQDEFDSIELPW